MTHKKNKRSTTHVLRSLYVYSQDNDTGISYWQVFEDVFNRKRTKALLPIRARDMSPQDIGLLMLSNAK